MRYRNLALVATIILLSLSSFGCAVRSRVKERTRIYGDTYIMKTTPAPVVQATDDGTPEAVISTMNEKFKGRIWNDSGRCAIVYELPPNTFEYRSQVTPGLCKVKKQNGSYVDLPVGQEQESLSTTGNVVYRSDADLRGNVVCETWKQTNIVRIPPGLKSPYLRALGGRTYLLNTSQTASSGQYPYDTVFRLNIDAGVTTIYRGDEVDWAISFHTCYAR